jgi:putative phosphoribosyl transferase
MGSLRIVAIDSTPYEDRREAGRMLAAELLEYKDRNAIVLGIPRGGITVAAEVAGGLNADLDIILSRKLRTPGDEELAMGAVSESGEVLLNETVISTLNIDASAIKRERKIQMEEIAKRGELIRIWKPRVSLKERIVIVTDDGIATGATAEVALRTVRREGPEKLIAAFPVGTQETAIRLAEFANETVILKVSPYFSAVGQFYRHFNQIEDSEVIRILADKQKNRMIVRP